MLQENPLVFTGKYGYKVCLYGPVPSNQREVLAVFKCWVNIMLQKTF